MCCCHGNMKKLGESRSGTRYRLVRNSCVSLVLPRSSIYGVFYLISSGHTTPYFHWKAHNFAYFITVRSHYFYTIMQYTSHFININFSSFSGLYIHLFKKPCEGYVPQIFLFFHFNFCSTLLAGSKHVLYLSWEGFQHSILRPLWASCPH